jgi:aromatic-L-amino-acid decarboxylase
VWLAVSFYGTRRLRAAVAEKRALALDAASRIASIPGIVMSGPPQLSLFPFYVSWPGATRDQENEATQQLLVRVRDRGRVFLTGCWIDDRYFGRVCVLSFRTRQDRIDDCVQHVTEEAAALLRSRCA